MEMKEMLVLVDRELIPSLQEANTDKEQLTRVINQVEQLESEKTELRRQLDLQQQTDDNFGESPLKR